MLIERIEESDIEFMETYYNPVALTECVFSTLDNLIIFDETLADVRLGQLPMFSFEYMIEDEYPFPGMNERDKKKANFKHKENSGTVYAFGARRFGKTLIVEQVDMLLSMLLLEGEHVGFSSADALHIRGIIEKVVQVLRTHDFFKLLDAQINRSPNYRISLKSGYLLESINMNIYGQNAGNAFFQKHLHRLYIEEASMETEEIFDKRRDSISEDGCVYRIAGMTDFTKYSPAGRMFFSLENKSKVCNLPQYINPKFDETEKRLAIENYGGEQSANYRVFVKGEVVEEGIAVFDMEKVRKQYLRDKQVKVFEINKENFKQYESILIIERPANAKAVYVCGDIGETAPTDIVIVYEVNDKFYWTYEIVAYRLDDKQQAELIEYISRTVEANIISLDITDGTGRAIFRALGEKFPKENLIPCAFNEKIAVGFARDEKNRVIFENGKPKYVEEFVSEWSIKRLKTLFYEGHFFVPSNHNLDKQLNSVISHKTGPRVAYELATGDDDHLLSAMRVFSIANWQVNGGILKALNSKKFSKLGA